LGTFRTFFLEANQTRACNVHDKYGKKILKHCCGDVKGILDLFVEMGYDAYHVLEASVDMDLCTLKEQYGSQITLWGGVPSEHLVRGTTEQVRQDVRRAMACAKPCGRFILGSSQTPSLGIRYDNFMAMLDENQKLGAYP
jgi:uroporphyrinogen decarboxylase